MNMYVAPPPRPIAAGTATNIPINFSLCTRARVSPRCIWETEWLGWRKHLQVHGSFWTALLSSCGRYLPLLAGGGGVLLPYFTVLGAAVPSEFLFLLATLMDVKVAHCDDEFVFFWLLVGLSIFSHVSWLIVFLPTKTFVAFAHFTLCVIWLLII